MRRRIVALGARPEFWLLCLLAWASWSALRSAGTPWARVALTEWLRWAVGIGVVLALGRACTRTRMAARALTLVAGALALAGVCDGITPGHAGVVGPFRDHQLYGSALLTLLPLALAVSLTARAPGWRWGAQAIAVAGLVCLILTQTRSAWAGALAACAVFGGLWAAQTSPPGRQRYGRPWIVPVLLAAGTALAFLTLAGGTEIGPPLVARAGTLQRLDRDAGWQGRLATWRGAGRMAALRPWQGWGLGRYPGAQWAFTRAGRPLGPGQRPSLSEEAHCFYLQTAAEMGLIGLGLYGAALGAFAALGLRALRQERGRRAGSREAILTAALALIAGQAVDAVASPSWQFAEVSLFFWAALGVGLAAINHPAPEPAAVSLPAPARRLLQSTAVGAAVLVLLAQVFSLGLLSPVEAYTTTWTYIGCALTPANATASVTSNRQVIYTLTAHYKDTSGRDQYVDVTLDTNSFFGCTGSSKFMGGGNTGPSRNVLVLDARDVGKSNLSVTGQFYSNGLSKRALTTINVTP